WDRTEFDFLDFPLLKEKILELKPDVIVNAVAYNMVDNCEINAADYDLALKLNRDLVSVLAEQPALLVHYSTDYVFSGSLEKQEFSEADIPDPLNKYGDSKLAGERELITKAKKYYLIRTSKLFGPQGLSAYAKPSSN
ncbi:MAG: sugar nucleotide-binding protein, partial [Candidatus Falkowbacteria bacterium]|nr:sugar nucleotide-binding protein [Candidatus Falkowbacteria bacterium]